MRWEALTVNVMCTLVRPGNLYVGDMPANVISDMSF